MLYEKFVVLLFLSCPVKPIHSKCSYIYWKTCCFVVFVMSCLWSLLLIHIYIYILWIFCFHFCLVLSILSTQSVNTFIEKTCCFAVFVLSCLWSILLIHIYMFYEKNCFCCCFSLVQWNLYDQNVHMFIEKLVALLYLSCLVYAAYY